MLEDKDKKTNNIQSHLEIDKLDGINVKYDDEDIVLLLEKQKE
jgi:hypothetical protein